MKIQILLMYLNLFAQDTLIMLNFLTDYIYPKTVPVEVLLHFKFTIQCVVVIGHSRITQLEAKDDKLSFLSTTRFFIY